MEAYLGGLGKQFSSPVSGGFHVTRRGNLPPNAGRAYILNDVGGFKTTSSMIGVYYESLPNYHYPVTEFDLQIPHSIPTSWLLRTTDAQRPWEKRASFFGWLSLKGNPSPKKMEIGAPLGN